MTQLKKLLSQQLRAGIVVFLFALEKLSEDSFGVKDLLHREKEIKEPGFTAKISREILIVSPESTLDDVLREMRKRKYILHWSGNQIANL